MSHATTCRQPGQVAVATMDDGGVNTAEFALFEAPLPGDFRIGFNEVAIGIEFPGSGARLVQEGLARRHLPEVETVAVARATRFAEFGPPARAATRAASRAAPLRGIKRGL